MADFGVPFNPLTKNAVPSPDIPLEERELGGYGIMFMKKAFAKLAYSHEPIMGKDAKSGQHIQVCCMSSYRNTRPVAIAALFVFDCNKRQGSV